MNAEVEAILERNKQTPCTCGHVSFITSHCLNTKEIWELDLPEDPACPNYMEGYIHKATSYAGEYRVCMVCYCRGEYVQNWRTPKPKKDKKRNNTVKDFD